MKVKDRVVAGAETSARRVMKAIYEQTDVCNRWQLVTAYGTCKALADIIEFKLENLDPAFAKSWESETSKIDFSEKLTGFTSSFGYLAERNAQR